MVKLMMINEFDTVLLILHSNMMDGIYTFTPLPLLNSLVGPFISPLCTLFLLTLVHLLRWDSRETMAPRWRAGVGAAVAHNNIKFSSESKSSHKRGGFGICDTNFLFILRMCVFTLS